MNKCMSAHHLTCAQKLTGLKPPPLEGEVYMCEEQVPRCVSPCAMLSSTMKHAELPASVLSHAGATQARHPSTTTAHQP